MDKRNIPGLFLAVLIAGVFLAAVVFMVKKFEKESQPVASPAVQQLAPAAEKAKDESAQENPEGSQEGDLQSPTENGKLLQ